MFDKDESLWKGVLFIVNNLKVHMKSFTIFHCLNESKVNNCIRINASCFDTNSSSTIPLTSIWNDANYSVS